MSTKEKNKVASFSINKETEELLVFMQRLGYTKSSSIRVALEHYVNEKYKKEYSERKEETK